MVTIFFIQLIESCTVEVHITVTSSQTYCYYGGAHGGVSGTGPITFLKSSGQKVDHFISPDAAKAMQPLLRKGLLRYYADCDEPLTDTQLSERLQIEGTIIPLPRHSAYPNATADSLIFTYQQYEIACYADGMPSFTIAISDLAPYLIRRE